MKKESNPVEHHYKFNWVETWFLERLEYKANQVLEIYLIGGKKEPPEDLIVGKINLGEAYPVVWDPSKRVIIRFFQPLTFQRLDESFAAEKGGIYTGERFRIYSGSEYLHYYTRVTLGIVDVLSIDPPEIEKIY